MKILATVQARLSSSRLPGKVLKEICGKPTLLWLIERIQKSLLIDDVVVATTVNPADDEIVRFCEKHNVRYYRGSEDDVLSRVASTLEKHHADIHVEFFGDSPLPDPLLVDRFIGFYLKYQDKYDYVTNALKTTFPPGQEVAVYRASALIEADRRIDKNSKLREHVGIHIYKYPEIYSVHNIEAPPEFNHPEVYLEIDTLEDFEFVSKVVNHFVETGNECFYLAQMLDFILKNKGLSEINNQVERRWKEFREE